MPKNNFKNRNVLVAGGTGMVGQALILNLKIWCENLCGFYG